MNYAKHCLWLEPEQQEALRTLRKQTGVPVNETLRAMVDRCLEERVVNELFPAMSGQLLRGIQR